MVFLHDPETGAAPLPGVLASLYRLTPAEGRLAADLLEHLSLEEIAERRQVTRETLRTQLKELFRKSGTNRQSELVGRLTAGLAGSLRRRR
ncbi:MAG: helix-turn-helix transcriptional regulator [Reyranella sp.]|uniref:helix-turn-helix transcriptional regulator n=1 Tax=Reyranella sp. TaxID=1929291 RepID=UPI003D114197